MTVADYLDAVERRYVGDPRLVSALVLSPRPGAFVGVARTARQEVLRQTAEQPTALDAARELADLCCAGCTCSAVGGHALACRREERGERGGGTWGTVRLARARRLDVVIVRPDGRVERETRR